MSEKKNRDVVLTNKKIIGLYFKKYLSLIKKLNK